MGNYKVGDKVKVRDDLVVGIDYADNYGKVATHFVKEMARFRGEEVTISEDNGRVYKIKDDLARWSYTDGMLESIKPVEPLMERKVISIGRSSKMEIYVETLIINDPAIIMFYKVADYDENTGLFRQWSDTKKVIAKCNKDIGDKFDINKGVQVAMLKAYRKEIDKQLRKI
jgi:hypothetical protein